MIRVALRTLFVFGVPYHSLPASFEPIITLLRDNGLAFRYHQLESAVTVLHHANWQKLPWLNKLFSFITLPRSLNYPLSWSAFLRSLVWFSLNLLKYTRGKHVRLIVVRVNSPSIVKNANNLSNKPPTTISFTCVKVSLEDVRHLWQRQLFIWVVTKCIFTKLCNVSLFN